MDLFKIILLLLITHITSSYADDTKPTTALDMMSVKSATVPLTVPKTQLTASLLRQKQQSISETQTVLKRGINALVNEQKEFTKKIADLPVTDITPKMIEDAKLAKDSAQIEIEKLLLEQQTVEANVDKQTTALKEQQTVLETLQKTPATTSEQQEKQNKAIEELKATIELQQESITLEKQSLILAQGQVELANQNLRLLTTWHDTLQTTYQTREKQDLETRLQQEQQVHMARATYLRRELEKVPKQSMEASLLEVQVQDADERAQHVLRKLKVFSIREQLNHLTLAVEDANIKITPDMLDEAMAVEQELTELQTLLNNKISVLKQQQTVTERRKDILVDRELDQNNQSGLLLEGLINMLKNQSDKLPQLLTQCQELQAVLAAQYQQEIRRDLLKQRQLPTKTEEWTHLLREILAIPAILVDQLHLTGRGFIQTFQQTSVQMWSLIGLITLIIISLAAWGRTLLLHTCDMMRKITVRTFLANNLLIGIKLIYRNTVGITGLIILLLVIWLTHPNQMDSFLVFTLFSIALSTKLLINLAYLLLVDKELSEKRYNPKLYYQIVWIIAFTSILTVITVLAHILSSISQTVRELVDSIFMLFLSLTVFPVAQIRSMVLNFLTEKAIKGYWLLVIQLTSLLLPLSILTVSILGVIGYINLGWNVARHLSLFLLVLTGWLIARGLLRDLIIFLKNFALKHSRYGLLWTQDIIPLGHKLLGLALFILATVVLFWINGWYTDVMVLDNIKHIFDYPLFTIGNNQISIGTLLLSIATLWMVFWFGSWCRQITYRWIYVGINDLGIRHSLSVFTQYAVVLIGLLITLRIIGIDLTTLTVFAGALGVGIGFGLQNIANNFISGILLLIERPLRTGDIVNIAGTYEGHVIRIGIRSLTIQAWDYKEFIVPNSEIISNTFTNWTHSDQILRTTLYVNISYNDNPHYVADILLQSLKQMPPVLKDPYPFVGIWEFTDFAIKFRIDYYIDLSVSDNLEVRTAVLLKIWDELQKAGIKIPYPQRDIHLKTLAEPYETLLRRNRPDDVPLAT